MLLSLVHAFTSFSCAAVFWSHHGSSLRVCSPLRLEAILMFTLHPLKSFQFYISLPSCHLCSLDPGQPFYSIQLTWSYTFSPQSYSNSTCNVTHSLSQDPQSPERSFWNLLTPLCPLSSVQTVLFPAMTQFTLFVPLGPHPSPCKVVYCIPSKFDTFSLPSLTLCNC